MNGSNLLNYIVQFCVVVLMVNYIDILMCGISPHSRVKELMEKLGFIHSTMINELLSFNPCKTILCLHFVFVFLSQVQRLIKHFNIVTVYCSGPSLESYPQFFSRLTLHFCSNYVQNVVLS